MLALLCCGRRQKRARSSGPTPSELLAEERSARACSEAASAKKLAEAERRLQLLAAERRRRRSSLSASATQLKAAEGELRAQLAAEKFASSTKLAAVEGRLETLALTLGRQAQPWPAFAPRSDVPFHWCEVVARMGGAYTLSTCMRATLHHDTPYQLVCANRGLSCGSELSSGLVKVKLDFGDAPYYNMFGFVDEANIALLRRGKHPFGTGREIPGTFDILAPSVVLEVDTERGTCSVDGEVVLRNLPDPCYLIASTKMNGAVLSLEFPA
jgi:hypothetical protein